MINYSAESEILLLDRGEEDAQRRLLQRNRNDAREIYIIVYGWLKETPAWHSTIIGYLSSIHTNVLFFSWCDCRLKIQYIVIQTRLGKDDPLWILSSLLSFFRGDKRMATKTGRLV